MMPTRWRLQLTFHGGCDLREAPFASVSVELSVVRSTGGRVVL